MLPDTKPPVRASIKRLDRRGHFQSGRVGHRRQGLYTSRIATTPTATRSPFIRSRTGAPAAPSHSMMHERRFAPA